MKTKNINTIFKELNKNNTLQCTQKELDSFLMSGLLFKSHKGYLTRDQITIDIDIIEEKYLNFDLDFRGLIEDSSKKTKNNNIKRIYYMTPSCYNKYKSQGLIITKDANDYYRLFDRELWLVSIIQ